MRDRDRALLLLAYVVALLAATLAPLPRTAYEFTSSLEIDKAVHVVLFGGLVVAILLTVRRRGSAWPAVWASVAGAALVEILQLPLSYRTADVWDFLAGAVGAVAVGVVAARRRRDHPAPNPRP